MGIRGAILARNGDLSILKKDPANESRHCGRGSPLAMNKDQAKGGIKEAVGKARGKVDQIVGSRTPQANGLAKEVEGKAQKGLGDAKETLKESGRKVWSRSGPLSAFRRVGDSELSLALNHWRSPSTITVTAAGRIQRPQGCGLGDHGLTKLARLGTRRSSPDRCFATC